MFGRRAIGKLIISCAKSNRHVLQPQNALHFHTFKMQFAKMFFEHIEVDPAFANRYERMEKELTDELSKRLGSVESAEYYSVAVQEIIKGNYDMALVILRNLECISRAYEESIENESMEVQKIRATNASVLYEHLIVCCRGLHEYDQALLFSDRLLSLEQSFKELNLLDNVFRAISYALTTKAAIAMNRKDYGKSEQYLDLAIDGRLRKYLQSTIDPQTKSNLRTELHLCLENRANLHNLTQNYEKALEDISEAISLCESSLSYRLLRSEIYMNMSQYDEALKDIELALERGMDDKSLVLHANRLKIRILLKGGRFHDALPVCHNMIDRFPTHAIFYAPRAFLHYHLGHIGNAIADFEKVRQLSLRDILPVYKPYEKVVLLVGSFDQCIQDIQQLRDDKYVDEKWAEMKVLFLTAEKLLATGNYREGIERCKLFIKRYENEDKLFCTYMEKQILDASLLLRDNEMALQQLKTMCPQIDPFTCLLEEDGVDPNLASRLLLLFASNKQVVSDDLFNKTIHYINNELQQNDSINPPTIQATAEAYVIVGIASYYRDHYSLAVSQFQTALRIAEKAEIVTVRVLPLLFCAKSEMKLGQLDEAKKLLAEANKLCPNHNMQQQLFSQDQTSALLY